MNDCLSEERLFLLSEGEGTPAETAHARECPQCASRHRNLAQVVELVGRTLRHAPLPASHPPRVAPVASSRPWAAGFALAAGLVLSWGLYPGHRDPWPSPPPPTVPSLSLTDLTTALFASQANPWRSDTDTDVLYLAAAFRGEDPCERQTGTALMGCN